MKSIFSSNGISVSVDHHLLRNHGFMSGQKLSERRVWDKEKVASSSTFYNNPSSVKVASLYDEDENCDENLKFRGDDNDINEEIRYEGFAEKFWATLQNR